MARSKRYAAKKTTWVTKRVSKELAAMAKREEMSESELIRIIVDRYFRSLLAEDSLSDTLRSVIRSKLLLWHQDPTYTSVVPAAQL